MTSAKVGGGPPNFVEAAEGRIHYALFYILSWTITLNRAQTLNPSFRPRVPKPYFPAPGPFKTSRGHEVSLKFEDSNECPSIYLKVDAANTNNGGQCQ